MKNNKMYSIEIVDKATSAAIMGFICNDYGFIESIKDLPKEIRDIVLASILAGYGVIHTRVNNTLHNIPEIEKK